MAGASLPPPPPIPIPAIPGTPLIHRDIPANGILRPKPTQGRASVVHTGPSLRRGGAKSEMMWPCVIRQEMTAWPGLRMLLLSTAVHHCLMCLLTLVPLQYPLTPWRLQANVYTITWAGVTGYHNHLYTLSGTDVRTLKCFTEENVQLLSATCTLFLAQLTSRNNSSLFLIAYVCCAFICQLIVI